MDISRRQFIKLTSGSIAAAGTYLLFWEQEKQPAIPEKAFISLSQDFSSAADVTKSFVRAKTPFLMASYAVFYPDLLHLRGRSAVQDLKKAKEAEKLVYSKDHHRLDSLPAVAAAHLLPVTVLDNDRDNLCKEIANALKDNRREVKEIVLQNLITAASPNIDVLRFFTVSSEVLKCIENIISETECNEKLLTPASLCAEFLLNARLLLRANKAPENEIEQYNRLIKLFKTSRADHFWFVSKLADLHEATFTSPEKMWNQLLPQSSEALMRWKNFGYARDYLSHLALLRARLIFTNLYTFTGKIPSDNTMNSSQAKRALPKTISFYKNFNLNGIVNIGEAQKIIPQSEKLFTKFLSSGELYELINNPDSFDVSLSDVMPDKEEIKISKCVPFAQYRKYGILEKLANSQDANRRKFIVKAVDAGWKAAVAGYGAYQGSGLLHDIVARVFVLKGKELSEIPKEVKEEAVEEVVTKEESINTGQYEGVDQQERELGKIDFKIKDY